MRTLLLLLLACFLEAGIAPASAAQTAGPMLATSSPGWGLGSTGPDGRLTPQALAARVTVPGAAARSRFTGAWRGALIGLGVGAVLGGYGGYRLGREYGTDSSDQWEGAAIGAGLLGTIGALVGFAIDSDH